MARSRWRRWKYEYDRATRLRVNVVHVQVSDVEVGGTTSHTTWKSKTGKFDWSVTRPEVGVETSSMRCPYCQKTLEIRVDSLARMATVRARCRKVMIASVIAFAGMGLLLFASIFFGQKGLLPPGVAMVMLIVGFFGLCGSFAAVPAAWARETLAMRGFTPVGDLRESEHLGPHSQHFVESVEVP